MNVNLAARDPARAYALSFAVVAGIGAIPGAVGTASLALMTAMAFEKGSSGFLGLLAALAFTLLGHAQLVFYVRRARGPRFASAKAWWISTQVYNLLLGLAAALACVMAQQLVALPIAVWFFALAWLAGYAERAEPES